MEDYFQLSPFAMNPLETTFVWIQGAFIIGTFVWFFVINSQFSSKYPAYSGKYLWSLIFVPIYFIMWIAFSGIYYFACSMYGLGPQWMGLISIALALLIGGYFFNNWLNIKRNLFNWDNTSEEQVHNKIGMIIIIGAICQFVFGIFGIITYIKKFSEWYYHNVNGYGFGDYVLIRESINEFFNTPSVWISSAFSLIIMFAIDYWAWRAANLKISTIGKDMINRSVEVSISPNNIVVNSTMSSQINSLKDLKKLLDDGVLSEEEFNKMKKEILKAGI